jgi:hypothetical protein
LIQVWGFQNTSGTEIWFFSNPLNGGVTISGTITPNIRALESNGLANYGVGIEILRFPNGGSVPDATIVASVPVGLELGTSEAARTSNITPTSTAIATGDRIVIKIGWYAAGGTSASGRTATGFWNGASGATGDTFVTFAETLTEQVIPDSSFPFIGGGYYP